MRVVTVAFIVSVLLLSIACRTSSRTELQFFGDSGSCLIAEFVVSNRASIVGYFVVASVQSLGVFFEVLMIAEPSCGNYEVFRMRMLQVGCSCFESTFLTRISIVL